MKHLLIPLLACGLPLAARAQAPPGQAPADTARVYKHELGLTASPQLQYLFSANRVLPVGLLYKYHLNERNALRLRVVGQYSRRDTTTKRLPGFDAYLDGTGKTAWSVDLWLGYERAHPLGRRWTWNVGADIGAGLSRLTDAYVSRRYPSPILGLGPYTDTFEYRTRQRRFQGRGFAGVSFKLSSRVKFFAETALLITHQKVNQHYEGIQLFDDPRQVNGYYGPVDLNNRTFTVQWRPLQLVGAAITL